MRMHAGKGTDAQLEVREARAELLGPALEDARLALHAPYRDLAEAGEVVKRGPYVVAETVECPNDELPQRKSSENI